MPEPFSPIDYLDYLRARWRFAVLAVGGAVLLTALGSWLAPKRYTATATLMIEPPTGGDGRGAAVISPIYLESLKSYEEFASSDTLFAKAVEKFRLNSGVPIETLKRKVLEVRKPKETKLLAISVTLADAGQAQRMAQFLAEETVAMNSSLVRAGEAEVRAELDQQLERSRAELERSRAALAAVEASGSVAALDEEVRANAELRSRTTEQLIAANALLAELAARKDAGEDAAATRARVAALTAERAGLEREAAAKAAALAALRARLEIADDRVRAAQAGFTTLAERAGGLAASGLLRSEQIRVVDPGIVPQRPSFPRLELFTIAAFLIATVLSLAWLSLEFGLSRQRARVAPAELKVARGGR